MKNLTYPPHNLYIITRTCFYVFFEIRIRNFIEILKLPVLFTFLLDGIIRKMYILVVKISQTKLLT